MQNDPEAIAQWLAMETGHVADGEAYEEEEEQPKLPIARRANLRQFFDGIDVEKKLTERRRAKAMEPLDQADALMKAVQEPPAAGPTAY